MKRIFNFVIVSMFLVTAQSCENETIIACPRQNMTCEKPICSCGSKAPPEVFYHMYIDCIKVLSDIPADIPKEALYIRMTGNNITTIKAGAFEGLYRVGQLYLSENNVEIIEPGAFANLPGLFYLDLTRNRLTKLASGVFRNLPVNNIYMTGNNITVIEAYAYDNLTGLSRIDFQDNHITDIESKAFNNMPSLASIKLSGNKLTTVKTDVFKDLPVQSIDLKNNNIVTIKKRAFTNLTNLYVIYLENNFITNIEREAFHNLPNLALIDLSGSEITIIESRAFSSLTNIAELKTFGTVNIIQTEAFFNLTSLTKLDLKSRKIMEIHQHAFAYLPRLQELSLQGNNITSVMAGTFDSLNSLYMIDLSNNNINDIDVGAFVDLPALGIINLSNNKLTRLQTDVFMDIPVSKIELSQNNISQIKQHAFHNLEKLSAIYLANNIITDIEREAFRNLPLLSVIFLTGSPINTLRTDTFKDLPVQHIDFGGSRISVIESRAFNNLDKISALTTLGTISKIKTEAFFNLSSLTAIVLPGRNITEIQPNAFASLPKLQSLILYNNALKCIEENMFSNLPSLNDLILNNNQITTVKKKSFCNLPALRSLILVGNQISVIEEDAFVNVQATQLVMGIDENFVIKENVHNNFTSVSFTGNPLNCNCSFMWFPLWLKDHPLTKVDGFCKHINKSVEELVIKDFKYCYENRVQYSSCNISQSVEFTCSSIYIKSNFQHWIHTQNGTVIRKLSGQSVSPDTNVLSIAFCSYEDAGDYTCVRTTNYSALPDVTFTTKLSVRGPPIILNQSTKEEGNNLIMCVVFYCEPFKEPDWLLGDIILSNSSHYVISTGPYLVALNQRLPSVYEGFITSLTIFNYKQLPSKAYTSRLNNIYGEIKEKIISRPVNIEMDRTTYCNTSSKTEIKCSFGFDGSISDLWIHSYNGQTIRTLAGTGFNNTNSLIIPFCNYQDMGDYTCTWRTDVPDMFLLNKTSTLVVSGPPIVLEHVISRERNDTILSLFFISTPFPIEPRWYFHGIPVILGYEYQQTTTFATVSVRQHSHDIDRMGFISNLTIVNSRSDLFGVYTCKVVNDFGYLQHDIVVNEVHAPNTLDGNSSGNSSITIIGIICASVVFVIITILTIVLCKKRTQTKDADTYVQPSVVSSALYDSFRFSKSLEMTHTYIDVC